jgi:two-component system LytT family response regulator
LTQGIRTLIVDDEPLARDAIRVLLSDDPEVVIIGECRNGKEAVQAIREQAPDLVFLDVQMPDLDGFQVIEQVGIENMPVTVFVTAFEQHAVRAFEANALDYILKPFDHDRFYAALQRAKNNLHQRKFYEQSRRLLASIGEVTEAGTPEEKEKVAQKYLDRLVIKTGGRILFVRVEDIDWIEASGDYMTVHVGSTSHLLRETMNDLAAKLDEQRFFRIHRSTIVNVDRVKEIQPFFRGEHIVTLKDGKKLKMSRSYRDKLEAILGQDL